jgi:class 3 adenylate cyclase/CHASE2 domain-containing sensor protein
MTRFERRLLFESSLLGIALTLLTVLLVAWGALKPLELALDDFRAAHFQYFRPAPSGQVVYVDIDDGSLDAIGHFPWPWQKLALILDEINLAGAKVADLDIIFSEAEDPTARPGEAPIDNDQRLADAIRRFGEQRGRGVLVPLSINITDPEREDPLYLAAIDKLRVNLELDEDELTGQLRGSANTDPDLARHVSGLFHPALEAAMFERLRTALEAGRAADAESLRAILLPQSEMTGLATDAVQTLERVLPKVRSFESLRRFSRPPEPGLPPLLTRRQEQELPIPELAAAAKYSGFVDFWPPDNTKIRSIPLWVIDRGRLLPQMGMALACAQLGVSTNDLILTANQITIPCPDGRKIVIPVHTRATRDETAGMLMDLPWFGNSQWQTMYDWPSHRNPAAHLPMTRIWDICQIETEIVKNNRAAFDAVCNLAFISSPDDAKRVREHPPAFNDAAAWDKLVSDTLDNLPPGTVDNDDYKAYLAGTATIDSVADPKERELALDLHRALNCPKVNDQLLEQRRQLRQALHKDLSGKAVMIGEIATAGGDLKTTPLHESCPGAVVHGVIADAILSGMFLYRAPTWTSLVLTVLVGLLVTLVAGFYPGGRSAAAAIGIVVGFLLLDFLFSYDWRRVEIDAAGPPVAAVLVYSTCTLWHFVREKRETARIKRRFSSYVDPQLVNYVLDHPKAEIFAGERRELSVVFTDLAGFTTVSELLKEETVGLLNEYLGLMVPVIARNHGLVNKFLGDGIMFFFGAPEPYPGNPTLHAWAAVHTVMEMQQAMIPFNEQLVKRGLPQLKMRAGVSTGDMTVGDAGNPPERSDYTVLGDRVNLASRLESANKYTGTLVMLSDRTVELLRGRYLVRPLARLQVVGKTEPETTYEPLAPMEEATDRMRQLVKMTTAVFDPYVAGRFADCIAAIDRLLAEFGEASQGKLCGLYRQMCTEYLENPPQEFHGQIKLESK